jgi:hypothetical protein
MENKTILRYIGNLLLMIGYYILLWGDPKLGLLIKCTGGFLIIPSFIYLKMWDSLLICGFYTFIEISKIIQLFLS